MGKLHKKLCTPGITLSHLSKSVRGSWVCVFFSLPHEIFRSSKCIEIMSWCSAGMTFSTFHWNSLRYTNGKFYSGYAQNQNIHHVSLSNLWSVSFRLHYIFSVLIFKHVLELFIQINSNNRDIWFDDEIDSKLSCLLVLQIASNFQEKNDRSIDNSRKGTQHAFPSLVTYK